MDNLTQWVIDMTAEQQGAMLVASIILLSYLLEDLAIITAAVLASNQDLSLSLAIIAILIGISTGDIGLYLLGRFSRHWRWFRYRLLTRPAFKEIKHRLQQKTIRNIFIIRFIPGLRSVGYALCGHFNIQFTHYISAVVLATSLWTAVVFTLVYQLGQQTMIQSNPYKWAVIPIALLLLILSNRTFFKAGLRNKEVK
ncbi:VTT domain-containing protein [Aliivibrio kagoshimensis]|uniref:VTT domain-containing protein n=1 Tax=Aliivibrio kagoshimensis TaxID=2910230 RepID=UPI003D0A9315